MDMMRVASEITSLKGQAFPLSHTAEPGTQHPSVCVLLVSGESPIMTASTIFLERGGGANYLNFAQKTKLFAIVLIVKVFLFFHSQPGYSALIDSITVSAQ